ncbi:hybrid sensor histidine kinase/response regulator [Rhodovulum visakhapatnamense]|uniref:histidine kinase n=1 Tax=Rhodovulum visakhapatnamense TaxID=364297 RepID=A0A4R8FPN1_9RHOB|nr:PAS domain-containing hybrid sensor histidine kinase/response regulator [Rhodovulum visakhapatnamense]TDX28283.1 PAS/PAC sensor hybrid histidine kinase [Rhodovulum visakhapatnamense]
MSAAPLPVRTPLGFAARLMAWLRARALPTGSGRIEIAAAAVSMAVLMGLMGTMALDIRGREERLHDLTAGEAQSALARFETEHSTLQNALYLAQRDMIPLERIRGGVAAYLQQADLVTRSAPYSDLLREFGLGEQVRHIDHAARHIAQMVAVDDAGLRTRLPDLIDQLAATKADVHDLSSHGADLLMQIHFRAHGLIDRLESSLALIALALISLLLAGIGALLRLARQMRTRSELLQASSSRFNAVVMTALDAVIVTDEDGRVLEFNAAAEQTFGYTRDEVIGRSATDLLIPPDKHDARMATRAYYREAHRRGEAQSGRFEMTLQRKTGERFDAELSVTHGASEDGPISVSFLRDISDRKAAEAELTAARDRALAGEKAKSRLVAVMSHEMRTPLNGLLGTMDLMQRTPLDAEQRQYLEVMACSGEILLHHVEDALEASSRDAGRSEVRNEAFDLSAKLRRVVAIHQSLARLRDTRLVLDIAPGLEEVRGDAPRLRQILINLISNAVKFTRDGTVTISAARAADGRVEIRVADTGIGIAPEDLPRIFDDFFTVDATYGREAGGTGLGLAIVARHVELLGGEIAVESRPGRGSVFTLRLDLPEARGGIARPAAPATAAAPARPLDVLVVEDNRVNRFVARRLLEGLGHRVTEAEDGIDGVAAATARRYDVILMDISMPRLDGVEAARRIRAASGVPPRIVAMTAHTLPADLTRFRAAGMDEVALKPVSRKRLAELLGDAFPETGRTLAREDARPTGPCPDALDATGSGAAPLVRAVG